MTKHINDPRNGSPADDTLDCMSRHGSSFAWASRLLETQQQHDAACLYAFFRTVDDLADDAETDDERHAARLRLDALRRALLKPTSDVPAQADALADPIRALAARRGFSLMPAAALIEAVLGDLAGPVRMANRAELLRYAYGVAGTVGVLMCSVLGARDPRALPFAIDLGIGMQLSNIARDVLEDAHDGRLYLPVDEVHPSVSPNALVEDAAGARDAAWAVVIDLLALARRHYRSADRGMAFLPIRSRLTALTASRRYEAIGDHIIAAGPNRYWQGRANVSRRRKAWAFVGAVAATVHASTVHASSQPHRHESYLHAALRGLPGANLSAS